jgi:hypothetical protein
MAQLFIDSFSIYATADFPTRWVGPSNGGFSITNAVLPPNSQVGATVAFGNGGFISGNNYGSNARLIQGFRYYRANPGSVGYVAGFLLSTGIGTSHSPFVLQQDSSGTYLYTGNSDGTLLATGPVVPAEEWHHYEMDVIFGTASNATINLYLDGNPSPFLSATGVSLTDATADTGFLGQPPNATSGATASGYYADYYLFSGTGAVAMFNSALAPQGLGAAKMAFSVPNAPGATSAWTPNGAATIWQSIDQIPQDGDSTYASSATVGQAYMCAFGTLPPMQTLISVQLSTYARTDDAGPRAYQSGFYSGGTYGYSGVNQFLAGTYNYIEDEYMLDPVTGLAWTVADLTGLQFGAQLTV